jgi:hypothetical protein
MHLHATRFNNTQPVNIAAGTEKSVAVSNVLASVMLIYSHLVASAEQMHRSSTIR